MKSDLPTYLPTFLPTYLPTYLLTQVKVVIFATGATEENFFHNFFVITKKLFLPYNFSQFFFTIFGDSEEEKIMKEEKNNGEKIQNITKSKESNFDNTQKLKISQNLKTQIGR